jgi:antitoxin HicB
MKHEKIQPYMAFFEEEEDGGYSVSVPALPGCFSQGDTFEEAKKNIEEAIRLYLDDADEETQDYLRSRKGEVVVSVNV